MYHYLTAVVLKWNHVSWFQQERNPYQNPAKTPIFKKTEHWKIMLIFCLDHHSDGCYASAWGEQKSGSSVSKDTTFRQDPGDRLLTLEVNRGKLGCAVLFFWLGFFVCKSSTRELITWKWSYFVFFPVSIQCNTLGPV